MYGPLTLGSDKTFQVKVEAKKAANRKNVTARFRPASSTRWIEDRVVITFGKDVDCPCEERPSLTHVYLWNLDIWRSEWEQMKRDFPNLQYYHVCVKERGNPVYNCYAWAVGIDWRSFDELEDPDGNKIDTDDRWQPTAEECDFFFNIWGAALGNGMGQPGTVAYYRMLNNDPTWIRHAALLSGGEGSDCRATSKLGGGSLISHDRDEMSGGSYGTYLRTNQ